MNTPEAFLRPGFFGQALADQLYCRLVAETDWDDRMKARRTACFGQPYEGSGIDYETRPMHPLLVLVLAQVAHAVGFAPTNCLLNYYPDGGSTMGFHSDAIDNLDADSGIAIVSLGAERELSFRHKRDPLLRAGYLLPHGSLFYMSQATQHDWLHAVKRSDTQGGRISLTFRRILPVALAA